MKDLYNKLDFLMKVNHPFNLFWYSGQKSSVNHQESTLKYLWIAFLIAAPILSESPSLFLNFSYV